MSAFGFGDVVIKLCFEIAKLSSSFRELLGVERVDLGKFFVTILQKILVEIREIPLDDAQLNDCTLMQRFSQRNNQRKQSRLN